MFLLLNPVTNIFLFDGGLPTVSHFFTNQRSQIAFILLNKFSIISNSRLGKRPVIKFDMGPKMRKITRKSTLLSYIGYFVLQ